MTDSSHRVRVIEGAFERYGLSADHLDQPVEQALPMTTGLIHSGLTSSSPIELPLVELHARTYSNINVLNTPTGAIVVLNDATLDAKQRKRELLSASAAHNIPWAFISALDLGILEESSDGTLTLLKPTPQWMETTESANFIKTVANWCWFRIPGTSPMSRPYRKVNAFACLKILH